MKKLLLILMIITIIFNPIKSYSQSDNDAAILAGAATVLSIYAAIEQQKEMLEQQALNYLLSSHPEYTNFRLKVIGLGQGGQKLSDNSNSYIKSFHKDHVANLINVCEKCHNEFHKNNKQHRKVKTTTGYDLEEVED